MLMLKPWRKCLENFYINSRMTAWELVLSLKTLCLSCLDSFGSSGISSKNSIAYNFFWKCFMMWIVDELKMIQTSQHWGTKNTPPKHLPNQSYVHDFLYSLLGLHCIQSGEVGKQWILRFVVLKREKQTEFW